MDLIENAVVDSVIVENKNEISAEKEIDKYISNLLKSSAKISDRYFIEDMVHTMHEEQIKNVKKYLSEGSILKTLKNNKHVKKHIDGLLKQLSSTIMLETSSRLLNLKRDNEIRKENKKVDASRKSLTDLKNKKVKKTEAIKEKLKKSITLKQKEDLKKAFGIDLL